MPTLAPPKPPAAAHAVAQYARSVLRGDTPAGMLVVKACERHLRDLADGPARGLTFDAAAADRAITFFSYLPHSKGEWAGQPFTLAPWQAFIVGSLFGWKRADGSRRFRTAYLELPRKSGKTTLAAGIGLLLAFFDGEQGAEVYCAATKRDQAKLCWEEARRMVLRTPRLRQRITPLVGNLHSLATQSKFQPLGADADTMDGLNISGAVVDELHAHKTRAIVDVLETATAARRQPLITYITTAGYDRHSVCWQQHDYGTKVLDGLVEDDAFFAYVATLDDGDDWVDPASWAKANPNLGVSVKLDDLARKCLKAQQVPSEQNAFKRLHLDVWTESVTRWLPVEEWDAAEPPRSLDELEGQPCYGGLDLATTTDIAAFDLWFPDDEGGGDLYAWFWVPEDGIRKRAERDRVPYPLWAEQDLVTATEGNVTDYDVIRATIRDLSERFTMQEIAYDPWNATQLATQLTEDGATMVPFRQGFASMSGPCKEFERLVLARKVRHGGNPVLRWMLGNVAVTKDAADNIKLDKAKSTERIDGIVSAVMAVGRAAVHETGESIYEERGLTVLGGTSWWEEDDE